MQLDRRIHANALSGVPYPSVSVEVFQDTFKALRPVFSVVTYTVHMDMFRMPFAHLTPKDLASVQEILCT